MRLAYNWNRITAVYQSNGESTPKTTSFSAAEEMPSIFVEFFSFFSIEKPNIYHWMWWLSCTSDYRENCTICCRVKRTKKKKKTKIIKWSSHVTLIRRYEAKTNRNESESFFFFFSSKNNFRSSNKKDQSNCAQLSFKCLRRTQHEIEMNQKNSKARRQSSSLVDTKIFCCIVCVAFFGLSVRETSIRSSRLVTLS